MAEKLRKWSKKIFLAFTIGAIILFLLSCLAPYLHPQKWWMISLLGLGFPVLLVLVFFLFVFWALLRKKLAWVLLFALALGWKSILVSFAINKSPSFNENKKSGDIRIGSWNVARFFEWKRNNNRGSQQRLKILEQIRKESPDILCLQEFFHSPDSIYYHNIDEIQQMGYPYFYFSYDPDGWRQFIGSVIFSKYPIIDSGLVRYFRPSMPEALIYADIKINEDTLRVFTTHLQSVQFRKKDYETLSEIKKAEDSFFVNTRTLLAKMKKAIRYRSSQADIVRQIRDDSPYPVLLCGDFNDIPNSYTYFTIRGDMQDAFLKKGLGIGRTYASLSPTLRIDYLFADKSIFIRQFKRVVNNNSDHYMLVADVKPWLPGAEP